MVKNKRAYDLMVLDALILREEVQSLECSHLRLALGAIRRVARGKLPTHLVHDCASVLNVASK